MTVISKNITWRLTEGEEACKLLSDCVLIKGDHDDERDRFFESKMPKNGIIIKVSYDIETKGLNFDFSHSQPILHFENDPEPVYNAYILSTELNKIKKAVVIDITGMSVEALFIILDAIKDGLFPLHAVYTTPKQYVSSNYEVLSDYLLSDSWKGIGDIPGFLRLSNNRTKQVVVSFLGFEGGRFDELREHISNEDSEMITILPIPSYNAGWHMQNIYQNANMLKPVDWVHNMRRITAWNPFLALHTLETIYNDYSDDNRIVVSPMGTKPHTLATAIFALKYQNVEILYDHPIVTLGRSTGIEKIYTYYLSGLFTREV